MGIKFHETPNTRQSDTTYPAYTMIEMLATGEPDEAIAGSYALANMPLSLPSVAGMLYRHPPQSRQGGYAMYYFTFKYSAEPYALGGVTFNFDTTGATLRVPYSLDHLTYNAGGLVTAGGGAPGTASNPHGNVVNWGDGAEVVIPALKLSYTRRNPIGVVSESYAKALAEITGCVNGNPFLTFSAGELLFLGASGSDGTNAEAECSFHFVASKNKVLTIGAIAGVAKAGHDFIWIELEPSAVANAPGTIITKVHVERMNQWVDFASALGWA